MLNLITDRSQADVDSFLSLKTKINSAGWPALTDTEKASWMSTKGEYRYSDLNRVGNAIQYLSGLLTGYGYSVSVTARTNWGIADNMRIDAAVAFLADLINIKSAVCGTAALPSSMDHLGYKDANNIEIMLLEAETRLNAMPLTFNFAGGTFGGEVFSI